MTAEFLATKVSRDGLVLEGGMTASGSCHHRKSGACGGCYLRLVYAIEAILAGGDPKAIASEIIASMRAEAKR